MIKHHYPHREIQGILYPTFIKPYIAAGELSHDDLTNVEKVKSVLSNNDFAKLLMLNNQRADTFKQIELVHPDFATFISLFGDVPEEWEDAEASSNIYPQFKAPSDKALFPHLVEDGVYNAWKELLPRCYPTFSVHLRPQNTFIIIMDDFDVNCMESLTPEQKFLGDKEYIPNQLHLYYQVKSYIDMLSGLFRSDELKRMEVFKFYTKLVSKVLY